MPKQDWNINTKPAAAGDLYGLAFTNSQRLTYLAEAEGSAFGLAVQQGARSNTFKVGMTADGLILGVSMRQDNLESLTRPGDGRVRIPANQPIAILMEGAIQVELKTGITTAALGVNTNGEFGAVGGDFKAVRNAVAIEWPAAAGAVIPVMVSLPLPKP